MSEKLTPVAKITLLERPYDVAKNSHFHLVQGGAFDAYGKEYFEVVNIPQGGWDQDFCQALIDCLGGVLMQLQSSRDMRKGEGL